MKNTLCVLLLSLPAAAQVSEVSSSLEQPAQDYARGGSVSVVGSAAFGVGLAGPSAIGTGLQAYALSGGLAVRLVTRPGLTLEPRLATDGLLVNGGAGLFAIVALGGGLGAGWAFPLSRRLALTPMLSYQATYLGGGVNGSISGVSHLGSLELPLTVFFSKSAFVELYVRGGVGLALGQVAPAFGAGYRFGVMW